MLRQGLAFLQGGQPDRVQVLTDDLELGRLDGCQQRRALCVEVGELSLQLLQPHFGILRGDQQGHGPEQEGQHVAHGPKVDR